MLTSYPPSNLNRDDLGRPKTAVVGGTTRLRISSQSLKRAWRTSSVFQEGLGGISIDGGLGIRSKRIGEDVYEKLKAGGIAEKDAIAWARSIAGCFGKLKGEKEKLPTVLHIEQLAFVSPEEQKAIFALTGELIKAKSAPTEEQLELLRAENSGADIALFGRMLASDPKFNVEAAALNARKQLGADGTVVLIVFQEFDKVAAKKIGEALELQKLRIQHLHLNRLRQDSTYDFLFAKEQLHFKVLFEKLIGGDDRVILRGRESLPSLLDKEAHRLEQLDDLLFVHSRKTVLHLRRQMLIQSKEAGDDRAGLFPPCCKIALSEN
jgi:hypothetical protein